MERRFRAAVLHRSDGAYYERLGWREVACEVLLEQPTGAIRCPFNVMSVPFKPEFTTIESLDLGSASW
jgi:hypothetical protein